MWTQLLVILLTVSSCTLLQKEEFQHTAYSTNAYVTIGPFARQLLHGKEATFQNIPYNLEFQMMLLF